MLIMKLLKICKTITMPFELPIIIIPNVRIYYLKDICLPTDEPQRLVTAFLFIINIDKYGRVIVLFGSKKTNTWNSICGVRTTINKVLKYLHT